MGFLASGSLQDLQGTRETDIKQSQNTNLQTVISIMKEKFKER